jgi:hypothetical protein
VSSADQQALQDVIAQAQSNSTVAQFGFSGMSFANIGLDPNAKLMQYMKNPAFLEWERTMKSVQARIQDNPNSDYAIVQGMHLAQNRPEEQVVQEGDTTVDEMLHSFINSGAKNIEKYQDEFVKAGLLEKDKYAKGFGGDGNTLKTMEYAYWYAKQRGLTLDDAIKEMVGFHAGGPSGGGGSASARASAHEMGMDEYKQMLLSEYMKTWGVPPPEGYIERAMHAGMNVWEFSAHEKNKPAYEHSPGYQYDRLSLQRQIAQTLGSLGG